jgi:hypothetical protein
MKLQFRRFGATCRLAALPGCGLGAAAWGLGAFLGFDVEAERLAGFAGAAGASRNTDSKTAVTNRTLEVYRKMRRGFRIS